jgi:hypothetical protein
MMQPALVSFRLRAGGATKPTPARAFSEAQAFDAVRSPQFAAELRGNLAEREPIHIRRRATCRR